MTDITFRRRRLIAALLIVWLLLVMGGLWAEFFKFLWGRDTLVQVVRFLGLSYEQNLPTWYSAALLLVCAVQLTLISIVKVAARAPFRWRWGVLAAIFYYISLDEAVTLHESLSRYFDYGGVLYYGWVIPASIFVLVVGSAYLPFLFHLPPRSRRQFFVAGVLFVGGALGVELLLGYWSDIAGTRNLVYGLIDLCEESLEMLGSTLFLLALLEYLTGPSSIVRIRFGEEGEAGS